MAKKVKQAKKEEKKLLKDKKALTEEQETIRKFIIILVVIVVFIVGIYFLSKVIVNKNEANSNNEVADVKIDYSITEVGTILNRPYNEYYVMVYDSTSPNAAYYASLISNNSKDIKIYFCDLDNGLNKPYVSGEKTGNKNAKSVNEFSFGEVTLIKVKNGKVVEYNEDLQTISKILQ